MTMMPSQRRSSGIIAVNAGRRYLELGNLAPEDVREVTEYIKDPSNQRYLRIGRSDPDLHSNPRHTMIIYVMERIVARPTDLEKREKSIEGLMDLITQITIFS
jgi:hypothetical protein